MPITGKLLTLRPAPHPVDSSFVDDQDDHRAAFILQPDELCQQLRGQSLGRGQCLGDVRIFVARRSLHRSTTANHVKEVSGHLDPPNWAGAKADASLNEMSRSTAGEPRAGSNAPTGSVPRPK